MILHGLRLIVEKAPGLAVVGEASDGASALRLAESAHPDVVVADVHLPDCDGIDLAARIIEQRPVTKVIFLSADADFSLVRRALSAGGGGYLLKGNAPQDVIRAIEAVAKGGVYLCPEVAAALVEDYQNCVGGAHAEQGAKISEREEAVLRLVAEGLRNKEIADRLGVGIKSVETYRKRLLKKLGYSSTAELVRHAVREGLVAP